MKGFGEPIMVHGSYFENVVVVRKDGEGLLNTVIVKQNTMH